MAAGTSGEQTSAGSELTDENAQRLTEITGMETDGSIKEVDESEGEVKEGFFSLFSRTASPQIVNFNTKGNATTSYTEYGTGVSGYTNGAYGADAAYLGMENGKVKFMLSGVVGLVNADQVQVVNLSSAKSISNYKVSSSGNLTHYVTYNITGTTYASTVGQGPAPSYLKSGTTYYSYDGHYFYTDYGTMLDDYTSNTRSQSVNPSNPFYNYYQYLPMRSQSSYSASAIDSIMKNKSSAREPLQGIGSTLVDCQNTYGVNALLTVSVAANESGWGTSSICINKNNYFGLNAVDSSPGASANSYLSREDCVKDFTGAWMSKKYLNPLSSTYRGGFLGNKGSGINVKYASDPYWGEKAASIARGLDNIGGGSDYNRYTLGIKGTIATNHSNVNVRAGSSTSTNALYTTGTFPSYSMIVLNKTQENGFYKIQSDAVLNSARTAADSSTGKYNFETMSAYISSNYVTLVNSGKVTEETKKALQSICISKAPTKTAYTEGETFDGTGMSVKAKWSDGSESDVTGNVSYSKDALSAGTTKITFTYAADGITKTVNQTLTVATKVTVDSVSVNPKEAKVEQGAEQKFGVAVTGKGNPAQTVTWSVEGAKSADTKVDATGKLVVATDESAETITVKATSSIDTSKVANATVTVTKKAEEPADEPEGTNPGQGDSGQTDSGQTVVENKKVQDDTTGIVVKGTFKEDEKLKVTPIENKSDTATTYEAYVEPVKTNTILGVYDISIEGTVAEGETVELGFPVDEKYEGQKVVVLHYKHVEEEDKDYLETYNIEVKEGIATVEVSGFSPYVLALDDPKEVEEPETPNGDTPSSNTPSGDNGENVTGGTTTEGDVSGDTSGSGANTTVTTPVEDLAEPDNSITSSDSSGTNGTTGTGGTTENDEITGIDETTGTNVTTENNATTDSLGSASGEQPAFQASGSTDQTAKSTAESKKNTSNKSAVSTGDYTGVPFWVGLFVIAFIGMVALIKKKSNE